MAHFPACVVVRIDGEDLTLAESATGYFLDDFSFNGGTVQPVFDNTGMPIANLTAYRLGICPPFMSDPDSGPTAGVVKFGDIEQWVNSIELQKDFGSAVPIAEAARLAAVEAQNSAAASAAAAAEAGGTSAAQIDAHLGGSALDLVDRVAAVETGKASLVSGKVPTSQLPTGIGTPVFLGTVASQAAMLALSTAKVGDWCKRSDLSQQFTLKATPASTLSNWEASYAAGAPTLTNVPAGYRHTVAVTTPPNRQTTRTDIVIVWRGTTFPAIVTSGTAGAYNGDEFERVVA